MSSLNSRALPGRAGKVDVIVPVHRGLETTRRCIESVLQAVCVTPFELVLINDASPEPELAEYCASLLGRPGVTVQVNSENLGFVATVNRGMSFHPNRDVVLLNSDTEVSNDWLDRLCACANREPEIGTVTPFSNNATICSYPNFCMDNAMPAIGLAELDAVFARVNASQITDLPTAVGFCMYIKRACLDQVGLFDAERFGRGYGEENDFSLRAAKAGWRNVLCADTFVFHAGGVSFQAERERQMASAAEVLRGLHPDYDALVGRFVAEDAPAKYRRAVDVALARRRMGLGLTPEDDITSTPHAARLHVVHDLGGGSARWVRDFCEADEASVNLILSPYSCSHARGEGLVLHAGVKSMEPLAFWRFASPIEVTAVTHPEYRRVIEGIVRDFDVGAVLVSSLIGHALDALDTGLPTLVINHDFFPACPTINLHFGGVCQHCDDDRLVDCVANNPNFHPFPNFSASERLRVRAQYLELVARNTTVMVVPDDTVRQQLLQVFPRMDAASFVTIPHGCLDIFTPIHYSADEPRDKLHVVVLGVLPLHKGSRLLSEGLQHLLEFAEIHLVGAKEFGEIFRDLPGVHIVEQYTMEELPNILAAIQPDVGLLPSIVPETFSYTLSELYQLGIPPVATRLGAFARRILAGETGYLFDPNVEAMLACLRDIDTDRDRLRYVRSNLLSLPTRTATDMMADYHRLLPRVANADGYSQVRKQISQDPATVLMMTQALALSRQWKEIDSLRLSLHMKEEYLRELKRQDSGLQEALLENEQTIRLLELEAQAKADVIMARDAQLAAVYASTSWVISGPIRWAGNNLRKARLMMPLLRRPAALPSIAAGAYHAWRQDGIRGMKQALCQALVESTVPSPGQVAAANSVQDLPIQESTSAKTDRHQNAFRHFRESLTQDMRNAVRMRIEAIPAPPVISVLVSTYNTPEPMLRQMLDSVLHQWYPHWELCVVEDGSDLPQVHAVLEKYVEQDSRIKLSIGTMNCGLSHAMNRALAMAAGDFVVLLSHDDMLEEQALFRVAEAVLEDDPDMVYSDEVLVAGDGATVQGFAFRPTFSPEYLRSHPYIVHMVGFKPSLLRRFGGFDETLGIAQSFDLILRASEQAEKITHIPEILYRCRSYGGSSGHDKTADGMEAYSAILKRHLQRCGEENRIDPGPGLSFFDVRYPLVSGLKVAILVPTKNHAALVRACIESIERTVATVDHEIVLIDHESDDPDALAYFDSLRSRVTLLRYSGPFNFAAINNWAVKQLDDSHTHYLFCNNDIEAIDSGWLERMLELGQKPDVGIVGAKLYYPDRKTIQHAGVVVACCGVAENLGRFRLTSEPPRDPGYLGSLICNREVSAVTAACMLIRRRVFEEVAGFDEAIAVGYGDVDLCLRVGQQGYRILFCAHAELLHHESYTRGRSQMDPHPEDSERFVARWRALYSTGDPYFNPNLSSNSPNWLVAEQLEFKLDIRRRIFKK